MFTQINVRDGCFGGRLQRSHNDSGSNDTGPGPHAAHWGRFMRRAAVFNTGYVRLCNEKGAVSSCWKYAGFSWVFFFSFPGAASFFSPPFFLSARDPFCR